MKFIVDSTRAAFAIQGIPVYRRSEWSLDYVTASESPIDSGAVGRSSLLIDTLQIEVAVETGLLLFVWGYHPDKTWERGKVAAPKGRPGSVFCQATPALQPGVSRLIEGGERWATTYDQASGWMSVCLPGHTEVSDVVEFAQDTFVALSGGSLVSILVRARFQES